VFETDRRIRLGIWGLGRGMSFFNTCRLLNLDVVAGCDFNEHMRKRFLEHCPGAFATADADEFLQQDFDAVLLATFCPAHADDAIKCLQAGKHVLSEVTAFFDMAAGVRLVEEVQKRKRVYQLAENYPYTAANMWLANRWREGLFGDLMYGEYEYVHEVRSLAYTYIDGVPVMPGHTMHNWRSWFAYHYYCTHSLGPVMVITGTRPTAVEAFPAQQRLAGYPNLPGARYGGIAPSLIRMSNGGVVRNLMGATTNDSHNQRLWGTRGSSEMGRDGLRLRLGATGNSPLLKINPCWEGLGNLASRTGHGGGDFWTLYYFAREILTGEKGPFDIYGACDVTIPGIQALRSSLADGQPMEVPDFRRKADRDRYRRDDWQQERLDVRRGVFGGLVPKPGEKAASFSTTMKQLCKCVPAYRAYVDWLKVESSLADPEELLRVAQQLLDAYPELQSAYRDARAIVDAYPKTDGARILSEMLEQGEEKTALAPAFLPALKKDLAALKRKYGEKWTYLQRVQGALLQPERRSVRAIAYPDPRTKFSPLPRDAQFLFEDIRPCYRGKPKDGLVYARGCFTAKKAGVGVLRVGADGPFKAFVNRREVVCNPGATNPISSQIRVADVTWRKGPNEIVVAIRTNEGRAWGFKAAAREG
jgi:hypothetical protein